MVTTVDGGKRSIYFGKLKNTHSRWS